MAAIRARRRRGEVQVNVVVSERDLVKIAGSIDTTCRADGITSFISDSLAGSFSGGREPASPEAARHARYADAVSTECALRANAVASFISETVTGDAGIA
jgi:hypothetical protein